MIDFRTIEMAYKPSSTRPPIIVACWNPEGALASPNDFRVITKDPVVLSGWNTTLDRLGKLHQGWDGYDAEPPSELAVDTAKSFLSSLMGDTYDPSRVAPSVAGGVGITHKNSGRRVYVEFFNDGDVLALFSDGETQPRSKRVKSGFHTFRELTKEIRAYLDA